MRQKWTIVEQRQSPPRYLETSQSLGSTCVCFTREKQTGWKENRINGWSWQVTPQSFLLKSRDLREDKTKGSVQAQVGEYISVQRLEKE